MRYNSDDPELDDDPDGIPGLNIPDDDLFNDDPTGDDFQDQEAYDRHIEIVEKLDRIANDTERILSLVTQLATKKA